MTLGINRGSLINKVNYSFKKSLTECLDIKEEDSCKPCIFLSHRSLDKDMVRKIGEYIIKSGIDIYLDENDCDLQNATKETNDKKITECIQQGISQSSHILCILSSETVKSWWIPYEIGYGEKSSKEIGSLKLKELREIPSYLKIRTCLKSISELNEYLDGINRNKGLTLKHFKINESTGYQNTIQRSILEKSINHPLSTYLDL